MLTEPFERFLKQANETQRKNVASQRQGFCQFIEAARASIVAPARARLHQAQDLLALLAPWRVEHDILGEAGLTGNENVYTELLRWCLVSQPEPAQAVQHTFLSAVLSETKHRSAVIPRTQFVTSSGVPDLVLPYEDLLVVIEAKTSTSEHEAAQTGKPQTEAYGMATRAALRLPDTHPTKVILLTPDRRDPQSDTAIGASYLQIVCAIVRGLSGIDLSKELEGGYRQIIGHFLRGAVPRGLDMYALLGVRTWESDDVLIEHAQSLDVLLKIVGDGR